MVSKVSSLEISAWQLGSVRRSNIGIDSESRWWNAIWSVTIQRSKSFDNISFVKLYWSWRPELSVKISQSQVGSDTMWQDSRADGDTENPRKNIGVCVVDTGYAYVMQKFSVQRSNIRFHEFKLYGVDLNINCVNYSIRKKRTTVLWLFADLIG